jgi:hypothetical protein
MGDHLQEARGDIVIPGRENIPKKLRFAILTRDNFSCVYCGRSAPRVELAVDHVHPVAKGGTNEKGNLVTSCSDCNLSKATKTLARREIQRDLEELKLLRSLFALQIETPHDKFAEWADRARREIPADTHDDLYLFAFVLRLYLYRNAEGEAVK